MKSWLLALGLVCGSGVSLYGAQALVVVTNTGDKHDFELAKIDRLNFGASDLVVVPAGDGAQTSFVYSNIDKLLFSKTSGIAEIVGRGDIAVWLNPADGVLTISGAPEGSAVKIYSTSGMLMASGVTVAQDGASTFDLSGAASGVYVVQVGKQSVKILKK